MNWGNLSTGFLEAMVQSMYRCEAAQVNCPGLLTNTEMQDFYRSYCGM